MNVKEVLNAAADVIERDGWVQGAMSRQGRVCAAGAIRSVLSKDTSQLYWGARDALAASLGLGDGIGITMWNDARGRTEADVIAALRSAAEAQA